MSVASLYTPCFVMLCVFLYGPFCHGAHILDLSTLFTTFFFEHLFNLFYTLYVGRVVTNQRNEEDDLITSLQRCTSVNHWLDLQRIILQ